MSSCFPIAGLKGPRYDDWPERPALHDHVRGYVARPFQGRDPCSNANAISEASSPPPVAITTNCRPLRAR